MQRYLVVEVKRGRALAAKDKNGLSDPYVRLHLNRKRAKSKIKKKTLNPEWEETFFLGPVTDGDVLVLDCWDYDMGFSDDFMGRVEIMFNEAMLQEGAMAATWMKLEGRGRKEEISGDILLSWSVSDTADKLKSKKVHRHHGGLGIRRGTSVMLSAMKHGDSSSRRAPAPAPASTAPPAPEDTATCVPGRPVFGVAVADLMARQRDEHPTLDVPLYLHRALCALEESGALSSSIGIFRVSGRKQDVKGLLAQGEDVSFEGAHPHVITHIIKLFLRELPEPLLTFDLYDSLVEPACEKNALAPAEEVIAQVKTIPPAQFAILCRILTVFDQVISNSAVTKMDAQNLSIVMSPNLIWQRQGGDDGLDCIQSLDAYRLALTWVTSLVELLIHNHTLLTGGQAGTGGGGGSGGYTVDFDSLTVDEIFGRFDEDGNGELDEQEFAIFYKDFLRASGLPAPTNPEITAAICEIDDDGNGTISAGEFADWWERR